MKYTYIYKTSDGARHEAEISAGSREEAFAALRAQGVKPIKVIAADGSKANGEVRGVRKRMVAAAVVIAAVVTGIVVFAVTWSEIKVDEAKPSQELVELEEKAGLVQKRHRAAIAAADGDREKIKIAVARSRNEARELFKGILTELKTEGERNHAKTIYGELMLKVDLSEVSR